MVGGGLFPARSNSTGGVNIGGLGVEQLNMVKIFSIWKKNCKS